MKLILRVGDDGDDEEFDTVEAAAEYLESLGVGEPTEFHCYGFDTPNYHGDDFVALHWVDSLGGIQRLDHREREYLRDTLTPCQL